MWGLATTHHFRISQLKNTTATIFQSNSIESSTMLFKHSKEKGWSTFQHTRDVQAEGDGVYTPPNGQDIKDGFILPHASMM